MQWLTSKPAADAGGWASLNGQMLPALPSASSLPLSVMHSMLNRKPASVLGAGCSCSVASGLEECVGLQESSCSG